MSRTGTEVMVGTPICRRTSFALGKFLSNQREIQQAYPDCSLVLATDEPDFVTDLKEQIGRYHLKGEVINYETVKPDYARSRIWSIACGREALRRYVLSQGAEYLLFLDGDMVHAPSVISTMKARIQDFDVVSSGYRLPPHGVWGFGAGCLMLNREVLSKITFRCYEFKNGQTIDEDLLLDVDLFRCHARVNKGIFVYIKHYINNQEYYEIEPRPMGWFRTLTSNHLVKYILTRMSILLRWHITHNLRFLLDWTTKAEVKSTTPCSGKDEIALVEDVADRVDGWLRDDEGRFLYNAAKNCQGKGVIVEIGSWKGKSTIWLAKGSRAGRNVKVYSVDPHTGTSWYRERYGEVWTLEEFKQNIKRASIEDVVVPVVKTSRDAARDWDRKPIELLWVDGEHEYEMVKLDFDLWSPYLIEGGTIAFHDTIGWPGPRKLVREKVYNSPNFANVRFIGSLTYARKVRQNSLAERLRNRRVLFLKDVYELGAGLHLPKPIRKLARRVVGLIQ